ncbi:polysaccharide deacetylase family protein [Streptomyces sp. NPDC093595]|uniref:polysaccharide deacetylase family protein n=1 Tax=Streptomyces sp. NPDC093595 TaxID=3366045 RepID=UPI0037FC97CA
MAPRNTRPWVAMYHSIDDTTDDPYQVTVSPARLDRQLRWLRDRGLRGVGVRQLLLYAARHGDTRGLVGLTFDDGYADFLEHAVPVLRRHECTATVFVLPGRLGGENDWDAHGPRKPLLGEEGVRRCAAAGMEVASHGLLHVSLPAARDAALDREVAHSREVLRTITGTAPEGFCYPYGHVDARVVRAVREAGYAYGCAVDPAPGLAGVFALPRVHIGQRDSAWRLHAKYRLHGVRRAPVELPRGPVPVS